MSDFLMSLLNNSDSAIEVAVADRMRYIHLAHVS